MQFKPRPGNNPGLELRTQGQSAVTDCIMKEEEEAKGGDWVSAHNKLWTSDGGR